MKSLTWTSDLSQRFWRDLAGSEYLANIAFSRFAAPFLVDLVEKHLRKDGVILDFGAGDNLYLVRELLRRGWQTGYFEPNTGAIAPVSSAELGERFLGPVFEFEHKRFDTVFFSEVIEHLSDQELKNTMTGLSETLKDDGVLIVTTPDNEDLTLASRYCPVCRQLFHPWGHVRSFTASALETVLTDYGFVCRELHTVDFSSMREPLEEAKTLKRQIVDMVAEFSLLQQDTTLSATVAQQAIDKYVTLFADVRDPDASIEVTRRYIGAGGTLVAVARKRLVDERAA